MVMLSLGADLQTRRTLPRDLETTAVMLKVLLSTGSVLKLSCLQADSLCCVAAGYAAILINFALSN